MNNITSLFVFLLLLSLPACNINKKAQIPPTKTPSPSTIPTSQTWESALKSSFRAHYKTAFHNHIEAFSQNYPIIINDFLNMTLIRSNGERLRFRMNKKVYNSLAHTAHPPLATYLILEASNFSIDADSTIQKLEDYDSILQLGVDSISLATHLNDEQKNRIRQIFQQTQSYIRKTLETAKVNKEDFRTFALAVKPLIDQSLHESALEQLTQFKTKLNAWKTEFPEENWSELRVAVQGFHQPRVRNIMSQLFQWLLKEPAIENRVVYVEFQFPMFGKNRKRAEILALELVAKVDFERDAAYYVMGDENILQVDITGPASEKIIKDWEPSDWMEH